MRVANLFSGAGGAALGYAQAGFDIVGIDIKPEPNYPFEFIQGDALSLPMEFLRTFDLLHASPPCQKFTSMRRAPNAKGDAHPDLISPTRELLRRSGKPYCIENVEGASAMLLSPVKLCGSMFGLKAPSGSLQRHRLFETSFPLAAPSKCQHAWVTIGIYGAHVRDRRRAAGKHHRPGSNLPREHAYIAFGVPDGSMTLAELSEAIPPAYSRFIAETFLSSVANIREPALGAAHAGEGDMGADGFDLWFKLHEDDAREWSREPPEAR